MAFTIATGVLRITADTSKALAGLSALTGAAGVAGAALAALPALGAAAAGIGGVLAGSFAGVGAALKGYTSDQAAAAKAGTKAAGQEAANARQIRDATRAISDARSNASKVARESADKINKAMDDQVETARKGQASIASAQKNASDVAEQGAENIAAASRRVGDALDRERDAQEDLNDARQEAAAMLDDLREKVDDYGLSQEGAAIRVAEAEADLRKVNADATSTSLDRRKAEYDLATARERVSDLTREQSEDTQKLNAAERAGIEGSEQVVTAQGKLADAHRNTSDAQLNLAKVQRESGEANAEAAARVSEAQRSAAAANAEAASDVARARSEAASAEADAAQAVADAVQNLNDVQAQQAVSMASAAGGASAYADAMAKLNPHQRAFVEQLISMKPLLDGLSATSSAAFLPGLTQMLKDSEGLFPIFNQFLHDTGTIMGNTARQFGEMFKSEEFKNNLAATNAAALPIIQSLGDGLVLLTDKWFALGAASGPAAAGFAAGLDAIFVGLGGLFDALAPGMAALGSVLQTTLTAVGALLPVLGQLIVALVTAFAPAFAIIMPLITNLVSMLVTMLAPVLQALGPIVTVLAQVLSTVLTAAMTALQPFFAALVDVLNMLAPIISDMAEKFGGLLVEAINAVAPLLPILVTALGDILAAVIPVASVFLEFAGQLIRELAPFLPEITSLFVMLLRDAILPLIPPMLDIIRIILPPLIQLLKFLIPIIIDVGRRFVGDIVNVVQNFVIPILNRLGEGLRTLIDGFNRTKDNIVNAWNRVAAAIRDPYNNIIKPVLGFLGDKLAEAGRRAGEFSDFFGRKMAELREKARAPVQFVVDIVYNNGIRKMWNGIASTFGLGQLGEVRFAGGGVLPGYSPGRDTIPAMLSPGEGVLTPEAVKMIGAGNVLALNKAASGRRAGSTPTSNVGRQYFAEGGIAGFAANLFSGPVNAVRNLFSGVLGDSSRTPGGGGWRDALMKIPGKVIDAVIKKAEKFVADLMSFGGGGGDGGSGVQRWSGVTAQALGIMGQPASLVPTTLRRMNQESGGNPTIVNRWDSNWIKGTPSVGLMQVIGPTYRSNRHPQFDVGPYSYGTSVNPLANILSSMRYALGRYGSLPRAYNRPGGYDSGGWLPTGMSSTFNGTGRPEAILTAPQWDLARAAIQNQMNGSTYGDVYVTIDAKNVKDFNDVVELISNLPQASRRGSVRMAGVKQ